MTRLAGVLLVGALFVSGCLVEVTYDPVGTDFSVTGDWEIELDGISMLPNSANCAAAGISTVQLELYHESTSDFFTDGTLSAPCSQGTFTSGIVFSYGSYRAQWVARGSGGSVVARSGFIPFSAGFPTSNVVLPTAIFVVDGGPPVFNPRGPDFSVTGDWEIELGGVSMFPNPSNCNAAGIATVQLELYHETTTDFFTDGTLSAPCAQGTFTSTMTFRYGTYRAQWVARNSSGVEVARSGFIPFSAFAPTGNVILPTAIFVVDSPPVYGDMQLNLFWVDPAAPFAAGGDCAYAKVTDMFYELTQGSTVLASSGSEIACATRLDVPNLAPGTYDMYIEGFDRASGIGQTHMVTCTFTHSSIDEQGDCDVLPL